MTQLLDTSVQLNEQLTQEVDDEAVAQQQERHLEYVSTVAATKELADQYFVERIDDASSVV